MFSKKERVTINNKIKYYRNKKQLTQKELADRIGISERRLIEIEKNGQDPKLSNAFKIAYSLNVTVEELFRPPRKNSSESGQ